MTCANLKAGGKVLDVNDRLMSSVTSGRRESIQDFSRRVGMGYQSQDLTGAGMISLLNSVSETRENCDEVWRV